MVDRRHVSDSSPWTNSHLHGVCVLVVRVYALLLSVEQALVVCQHLVVCSVRSKFHHMVVGCHLIEEFSVDSLWNEGLICVVRRYQQLLHLLLLFECLSCCYYACCGPLHLIVISFLNRLLLRSKLGALREVDFARDVSQASLRHLDSYHTWLPRECFSSFSVQEFIENVFLLFEFQCIVLI